MNHSNEILADIIRQRIEDSIRVKDALREQALLIAEVTGTLIDVYKNGNKILFFGNGGSAADAQHLAAEFVGKYYLERRAIPALALNVNTSCLTAIGNDYGYDLTFARQIEALGNPGDAAIGISTSGNSKNVLEGIRAAKKKNIFAVGLTGDGGGLVKEEAEYCICVPSKDTPRIQEGHILIGHILCELIERELFGSGSV